MKATCALCGRATVPAAYIGAEAIGPTCAKRAGLFKLPKTARVRIIAKTAPSKRAVLQLDLPL